MSQLIVSLTLRHALGVALGDALRPCTSGSAPSVALAPTGSPRRHPSRAASAENRSRIVTASLRKESITDAPHKQVRTDGESMPQTPLGRGVVVGGGLSGLATACFLARRTRCEPLRMVGRAARRKPPTERSAPSTWGHTRSTPGAMTAALADLGVTYGLTHGPSRGMQVPHHRSLSRMPDSPTALLRSRALTWRDRLELVGLNQVGFRTFAARADSQPVTSGRITRGLLSRSS